MQSVLLLFKHGVYFGLSLGLPLLILSLFVRRIAERRGLQVSPLPLLSAVRFVASVAVIGMAGQAIFALLTQWHWGLWARLDGLAMTAILIGLSAGGVVPYFNRVKGAIFGGLAALVATPLYGHLIAQTEGEARMAVAALLCSAIALAVTLPIPVREEENIESAITTTSLFPRGTKVIPNGLIRPSETLICPSNQTVTARSGRKRRNF